MAGNLELQPDQVQKPVHQLIADSLGHIEKANPEAAEILRDKVWKGFFDKSRSKSAIYALAGRLLDTVSSEEVGDARQIR